MREPSLSAVRLVLVSCMFLVLGAPASGQTPKPSDAENLAALLRRPAHEQEQFVERLRADLDKLESPWFTSLRAASVAAAAPGHPRTESQGKREPKKQKAKVPVAPPLFPVTVEYHFGRGVIEPVDEQVLGPKAARPQAARKSLVEAAVAGLLPGTDLMLAELLRRLDLDASADRFAAFVESWRNGDESFYEALDRTAGTPESVFYYDAMLGDFVSEIAKKDQHPAELRSLEAAHDALHAAFLSYRQYRAFREAVALSLVLPPEVPLPRHLARYEEKKAGVYSLRQQVEMVLATKDFNVLEVADLIAAGAQPLPQPLWSTLYDPYPAWTSVFKAQMETMLDSEEDTDAFLAKAREQLSAHAHTITATVRADLAKEHTQPH